MISTSPSLAYYISARLRLLAVWKVQQLNLTHTCYSSNLLHIYVCMYVCMYVGSIMAMHPVSMGRYYTLAIYILPQCLLQFRSQP
jgi:hypothetical protein